ncbi:putative major facilitator superfamily transporter [Microthyrium microscopicum]|uniref:Putative major facilitator superfamily transporter n=1 Tax=Microthyrium microscopicum TaxID=703497 RepID=A0A6A6UP95_9PEZI|nr:putative major facilitator superfamily transporter [Microthyrium microscopicum]
MSSQTPQNHSTEPTHKRKVPVLLQKAWKIIIWTPPNCRWDPENPPKFSMALNVLFAFAGAFTVANLYYNHPILNVLAAEFHTTFEEASLIPTLMQAGYALGLFLLCPLGDILRRRPFVLSLVFLTSSLWIILCVTKSLRVFQGVSFVVAISTVTPQLMLPLVGDLAPPNRRATALAIVVSGFALGILIARVLSGTLTNYTPWRTIYWLSCGLQYLIFGLLWLFMPDYPSKNPAGLNYFYMLWSIFPILTRNPVLVQACLVAFFSSATFTNFWTTLTFLLAGEPYNYSPLIVGLFGLIGIAGMLLNPFYARFVSDRYVPHFSVLVGCVTTLAGICVGTYTGTFSVAGPVVQAVLNDFGMQTAQIANRNAIYSIEPNARNRVNVAYMLSTFLGQLMGTSAGNHVFAQGGWRLSGSASVGFIGAAILFALLRGPWEKGWIGWHGGFSMRKKDKMSADGRTAETVFYKGKDGDLEKAEGTTTHKALTELAAEEGRETLEDGKREDGESDIEKKSDVVEDEKSHGISKETKA